MVSPALVSDLAIKFDLTDSQLFSRTMKEATILGYEMHQEKNDGKDKKNVNQKARDVKRNEEHRPYDTKIRARTRKV